MKIVRGILNSVNICNDDSFLEEYLKETGKTQEELTQEELDNIDIKKMNYYLCDFWDDCNYIKVNNREYEFVIWDDEIIINEEIPNDIIEKALLHYFSDNWDEGSIAPEFDRDDIFAKLINGKDADIRIKYRNQGYTYSFCGYKIEMFT